MSDDELDTFTISASEPNLWHCANPTSKSARLATRLLLQQVPVRLAAELTKLGQKLRKSYSDNARLDSHG